MRKIIKRPFIKSVEFCIDENIWGIAFTTSSFRI